MRILSGDYCGTQVVKRQLAGLHIVASTFQPNQSLPWHVHQWPYFTFVLRGGYTEHYEGETWEIAEGDVVLHEAGEAHADRMHDGETYLLNLEFTQMWLDRIDGCGGRLDGRLRSNGGLSLQLGNRLHRELWSDDRMSALCIEGLALQLIAETAQIKMRPAGRGRWRQKAIDYLRAHFKESPTLHDVAEAAGVHPVHLAHEFRRTQGMTVGEYLRKLRVDWACHELVRSDQAIVDIAVAAGFSDHSHMTRVFRRQTGLTPSDFRRMRLRA